MLGFLLLTISLSLDSLGAGFTYGLKNIKLPFVPKFLFFATALGCSLSATATGNLLSKILPSQFGNILSAVLLFLPGLYMLITSFREYRPSHTSAQSGCLGKVRRFIRLIADILCHPTVSDLDASQSINPKESVLLGCALSMDAFGVGIGYGLSSSVWAFPLMTSAFHLLFLSVGQWLGNRMRKTLRISDAVIAVLPGLVLMVLGILHGVQAFTR